MAPRTHNDSTPVSLLLRLRQPGAAAYWDHFVDLYSPLLLLWARRLEPQEADAADLVQEVFVLLVRRLPHFHYDAKQSFRGWLRTVLLNRWRDRGRQRDLLPVNGVNLDDWPTQAPGPDLAEAEYRSELLRRAAELMRADFEPPTWRAFWECVVAGRPAAAVASELNLSVNAVYLAKGRVLKRLRQELTGLWE